MNTPAFLGAPPRFLFFTGKGGVGKTSIACATAVHLAEAGRNVLLVSTDPASNVGQVFGVPVGDAPTRRTGVPGLTALEIDPEAAAQAYRERIIGPLRWQVPEAEVASMTEQLSGPAPPRSPRSTRYRAAGRHQHPRRVRPHHLRHRTHRAHHPAAATARLLDRLTVRRGHRLVPGPAGRAGQAARRLRAITAGVLEPTWPATASPWLATAGAVTSLAGAGLLVGGVTGLGRQLTPFPRPDADAELRRDGVFGLVRPPMYGGALLLVLGWALLTSPLVLLPLGLAGIFLDVKRRREEAWLVEEHPDYPDYRLAVPRQFIPLVW